MRLIEIRKKTVGDANATLAFRIANPGVVEKRVVALSRRRMRDNALLCNAGTPGLAMPSPREHLEPITTCAGLKRLPLSEEHPGDEPGCRGRGSCRPYSSSGSCSGNRMRSPHRKTSTHSRTGAVRILEQNYDIPSASLNPVRRVPIVVDFSALLIVYDVIVPSGQSRERARQGLLRMKERFFKNIHYFKDEDEVIKTNSLRCLFTYLDDLLGILIKRLEDEPLILK